MGSLMALIGIVALLAVGSDGARPVDDHKNAALGYWQRILPHTPIPDALKDLIPSHPTPHISQLTHKQEPKLTPNLPLSWYRRADENDEKEANFPLTWYRRADEKEANFPASWYRRTDDKEAK